MYYKTNVHVTGTLSICINEKKQGDVQARATRKLKETKEQMDAEAVHMTSQPDSAYPLGQSEAHDELSSPTKRKLNSGILIGKTNVSISNKSPKKLPKKVTAENAQSSNPADSQRKKPNVKAVMTAKDFEVFRRQMMRRLNKDLMVSGLYGSMLEDKQYKAIKKNGLGLSQIEKDLVHLQDDEEEEDDEEEQEDQLEPFDEYLDMKFDQEMEIKTTIRMGMHRKKNLVEWSGQEVL